MAWARVLFFLAQRHAELGSDRQAGRFWLRGIRHAPGSMEGLLGFVESMAKFNDSPEGRKGEQVSLLPTPHTSGAVHEYVAALLDWRLNPNDPARAVRAAEAAAALDVKTPTCWIAARAFSLAKRGAVLRRDLIIRCADCFRRVDEPDLARGVAEHALPDDPVGPEC